MAEEVPQPPDAKPPTATRAQLVVHAIFPTAKAIITPEGEHDFESLYPKAESEKRRANPWINIPAAVPSVPEHIIKIAKLEDALKELFQLISFSATSNKVQFSSPNPDIQKKLDALEPHNRIPLYNDLLSLKATARFMFKDIDELEKSPANRDYKKFSPDALGLKIGSYTKPILSSLSQLSNHLDTNEEGALKTSIEKIKAAANECVEFYSNQTSRTV